MSKHTPGPWSVWEGPDYVGGGADICIGAGDTWLANMDHRMSKCQKEQGDGYHQHLQSDDCDICSTGGDPITEEQRANAYLIRAVTDLLAACHSALEVIDDGLPQKLELQLAITMATAPVHRATKGES